MPQRRCALRMQSVGEFEQLRAAAQPLAKRCDRLGIVVASSNRILAAFHAFTMCFAAASHRRRSQRSKSRAQSTCRPRDLGHRTAFTAASSTAFGAGTRRSADCSARSADCSPTGPSTSRLDLRFRGRRCHMGAWTQTVSPTGSAYYVMKLEPWCAEVSTVSTVSTECRGGVEGVSVDTGVKVSRQCRGCRGSVDGDLDTGGALMLSRCQECRVSSVEGVERCRRCRRCQRCR